MAKFIPHDMIPGLQVLAIESWEQAQRTANISSGSAAPITYSPIWPVPSGYTHVGHDLQYGNGRRWGFEPRLIVWHTTESDSFLGSLAYNARRGETVSAHIYVGRDGEIGYGVPEDDRAWTSGRWNDESLSIEICGRASWTAATWRARPSQIEAVADMTFTLCKRHGIPPLWLDATAVADGASRQGGTTRTMGAQRGITDHRAANQAAALLGGDPSKLTHWDIGDGLRRVMWEDVLPDLMARWNNYLNIETEGNRLMADQTSGAPVPVTIPEPYGGKPYIRIPGYAIMRANATLPPIGEALAALNAGDVLIVPDDQVHTQWGLVSEHQKGMSPRWARVWEQRWIDAGGVFPGEPVGNPSNPDGG